MYVRSVFLSRATVVCFLLLLIARLGVAQQPANPNPPNKPEIEQIVKDYILQHPEVLLESVRMYQEKERAAQQQRSKTAMAARQADLLNDPTSPANRPPSANPGRDITIIEFFDYRCTYCKRVYPTLTKLLAEHPNVRLVFKEFPILGPESVIASKAALAAEKQGKYFAFHQAMMASTLPVTAASVEQVAKDAGLDVARMKVDMESAAVAAILAKNTELAGALDVSSTPTFIIGSEMLAGALPQDAFEKLIAKAAAPKQP